MACYFAVVIFDISDSNIAVALNIIRCRRGIIHCLNGSIQFADGTGDAVAIFHILIAATGIALAVLLVANLRVHVVDSIHNGSCRAISVLHTVSQFGNIAHFAGLGYICDGNGTFVIVIVINKVHRNLMLIINSIGTCCHMGIVCSSLIDSITHSLGYLAFCSGLGRTRVIGFGIPSGIRQSGNFAFGTVDGNRLRCADFNHIAKADAIGIDFQVVIRSLDGYSPIVYFQAIARIDSQFLTIKL